MLKPHLFFPCVEIVPLTALGIKYGPHYTTTPPISFIPRMCRDIRIIGGYPLFAYIIYKHRVIDHKEVEVDDAVINAMDFAGKSEWSVGFFFFTIPY